MIWNNEDYASDGINTLLWRASNHLIKYGVFLRNERTDSGIYEIPNYVMEGNPRMRYLTIPDRKNNLAAQITEMMMVLSGNPELRQLSKFLPRAIDYSDDGEVWRGNYGTRIRGFQKYPSKLNGMERFPAILYSDQLKKVLDQLSNDKTTRQATITVHDSKIDTGKITTKDTPCTMDLVFRIIDDKLNLSVNMRSNDIQFGFTGVNYFIFTTLQELVATILNVELGSYFHHAASFHVYSNYFESIKKYASYDYTEIEEIALAPLFKKSSGSISLGGFDELSLYFFNMLDHSDPDTIYRDIDRFWLSWGHYPIISLLLIPIFYHHKLSKNILLNYVGKDSLLAKLINRDTFIPKHMTE